MTSYEAFLEELFMAILERRVRYSGGRVELRMTTKSRDALIKILLQGDKYMNWLPYKNTEDRARIYLTDGRPFSDINNGDRSIIKTITTIRNAIAHKSPHALGEFHRTITDSLSLLPGERQPASFLRSNISPAKNRFEVYIGELGRLAAVIC